MKHLKSISALFIGAALFVGCSNNAPASSVSKTVSKSCSTEVGAMKMKFTISAPSEDANIDHVQTGIEMPFSVIKELVGMTDISDEEFKTAAQKDDEIYKQSVASDFGVDVDSVKAEFTEDSIKLSVDIDDMDQFYEIANLPEDTELIFKDVAEKLEAQEGMTCE
ncbi:MAG: hypothetical protein Q4A59_00185 [Erysipelotrichaceae bacterium]|nr:hypothetical protein [Erysipelotrichaceae bacterium]